LRPIALLTPDFISQKPWLTIDNLAEGSLVIYLADNLAKGSLVI
jgi:hypothetical protein